MANFISIFKSAAKNRVFQYIISRYATYFIQFINSLFIAVYLGPYYLGIWGFITLILHYINHFNFGIAYSVNAIIAINIDKKFYIEKLIGASVFMVTLLSLLVATIFLSIDLLNFQIGAKYSFHNFYPFILAIGVLGYFNSLFSNIYRVYGSVLEIAIHQSTFPVLMLIAILLFKDKELLWALVIANLISATSSFLIFYLRRPVKFKPLFILKLMRKIQVRAWHLFIYNTSFYLIIISIRSYVSAFFQVEQFGLFTFAFALANVVQLLLESFSFLLYPKILNRLANSTEEKILKILSEIRNIYIFSAHILIHFSIFMFPFFIYFFPEYRMSENAFRLISLTISLHAISFGYSGLLIAKGRENQLGFISLISLLINIVSAFVLIKVLNVSYDLVILATLVAYSVYGFSLAKLGRITLKLNSSSFSIIKDIFPMRFSIPFLISLVLSIFAVGKLMFFIPLLFFIALNFKYFKSIFNSVKIIILNPQFIDI